MKRSTKARIFYGLLILGAVLTYLQVGTNLNPVGSITSAGVQIANITPLYNIPKTVYPFQGSTLDVVFAPTIKCDLSSALVGIDANGLVYPLNVANEIGIQPLKSFDITGGYKNQFALTKIQVSSNIYCPVIDGNTSYPPYLVSGTTSVYWTATKKDGSTVVLMQSPASKVDVSQFAGNIAGKSIKLATWTLTKDQIESALGAGSGDHFNSLQKASVTDQLIMQQGPQSAQWNRWSLTSGAGLMSYEFGENINGVTLDHIPDAVYLTVVSPTNNQINTQLNQVVQLRITLPSWDRSQGYPELKLFYTDPNSPDRNTPVNDFANLQPTTTGASPTFDVKYAFPKNAPVGQYTFKAYQNGRIAVPSVDIVVSSVDLTSKCDPKTQFLNSNGICQYIKSPPVIVDNGTSQGNSKDCNVSLVNGTLKIAPACGNQNQFNLAQFSQYMQYIPYVFGAIVLILVIAEVSKRSKTGGQKGVLPSPTVIVE